MKSRFVSGAFRKGVQRKVTRTCRLYRECYGDNKGVIPLISIMHRFKQLVTGSNR